MKLAHFPGAGFSAVMSLPTADTNSAQRAAARSLRFCRETGPELRDGRSYWHRSGAVGQSRTAVGAALGAGRSR
jgi:hypothetical protein